MFVLLSTRGSIGTEVRNDIEEGGGEAAQVDFSSIVRLIEQTPALNFHGEDFKNLILSMQEPIQNLINSEAILPERLSEIIQALHSFLEAMAPNIAEYTGAGISRAAFTAQARDFLNHFDGLEQDRPNVDQPDRLKMFWRCFALVIIGLLCGAIVEFIKGEAKYGIVLLVIMGSLVGIVNLCFTRLGSFSEPQSHQERILDEVWRQYFAQRKNYKDFISDPHDLRPMCFYELAAKLFAVLCVRDARFGDARDHERVVDVLNQFRQEETRDAQKFDRLLRESSPENMDACIDHLLDIPALREDGDVVTLRAGHILGEAAKTFMLECILLLKQSMGLVKKSSSDIINNRVDEAFAQNSPEHIDATLTVVTGGVYYSRQGDSSSSSQAGEVPVAIVLNPMCNQCS